MIWSLFMIFKEVALFVYMTIQVKKMIKAFEKAVLSGWATMRISLPRKKRQIYEYGNKSMGFMHMSFGLTIDAM